MTDLELLSNRVAKMETRIRWLKRVAILLGIVVTGGALMAQVRGLPLPGEVLPSGRGRVEADRIRPTTSDTYPRPAKRAAFSVLGDARGPAAGLPPMPLWRAMLTEALAAMHLPVG